MPRPPRGAATLLGLAYCACAAGACSSGGHSPGRDAGSPVDAAPQPGDAASSDAAASGSSDLGGTPSDLARLPDQAAPADLLPRPDLLPPPDLATAPPDMTTTVRMGIDIYVDNRCKMDVIPKFVDVPPGVTSLNLTYYNRSRDYAVDVWMSYGGGYKDLMTGASWAERFEHCRLGRRPYAEYADISTACSSWRLMINCK